MLLQEKSAGIVVFRREGNREYFLLLHYGLGHWGFTKGNIKVGETEKEAATREAGEETAITALKLIDDFREEIEYFYKRKGETVHKRVIYFLAETTERNIKLSYEHEGYKWLTFDEALKQLNFDNDKRVLKEAWKTIKNITSNSSLQLPLKKT